MRALSALGVLFAACQLWPRVAHAKQDKFQILIDLRRRWDDGDPTLLLRHLNLMTRNGTLTDEWEAIRQELASLSPVKLSKAFREQHPFDSLESWRDAMARIDFESGSRCGTQEIPAPLELLVDEAVRASIEAGTFQFNVDDTGTGTDAKREEDTGFNRSSTLTYIRDMIRAGTPHKRREGHTPLQEAAIWGLVEEAESLLKLGADIEARKRPGDPRFTHTETPLHCAAYQDHTSAVAALLLAWGANVDTSNVKSKETPLHFAARANNVNVVNLLIDRGANISHVDINDMIPLEKANGNRTREALMAAMERKAEAAILELHEEGDRRGITSTIDELAQHYKYAEVSKDIIRRMRRNLRRVEREAESAKRRHRILVAALAVVCAWAVYHCIQYAIAREDARRERELLEWDALAPRAPKAPKRRAAKTPRRRDAPARRRDKAPAREAVEKPAKPAPAAPAPAAVEAETEPAPPVERLEPEPVPEPEPAEPTVEPEPAPEPTVEPTAEEETAPTRAEPAEEGAAAEDDIPDDLRCPLTLELFEDPVTAQDGHTYERRAIVEWLSKKKTSPLTHEPLDATALVPQHVVRKLIESFREKRRRQR